MNAPAFPPVPASVGTQPRVRGFAGSLRGSGEATGEHAATSARPSGAQPLGAIFSAAAAATRPPPLLPPPSSSGARPTPLPKRPKGRLFVGGILLAVLGVAGHTVWQTFLRYDGYGAVTGRLIQISAPQSGAIGAIHVREGDEARQGQVVVSLESLELNQQLERLGDDLRVAQANLDSELCKLQWQAQQQSDQAQNAAAEYFELWADVVQQQTQLRELESRWDRAQLLKTRSAISDEQFEAIKLALAGQRPKLEKMETALTERRRLVELSATRTAAGQLKPQLAKIDALQAEMARLREQIQCGQVRAPVSGRVVRLDYFLGERVAEGEPLLEILEAGSLQAVVYLSQSRANRLERGRTVWLDVESHGGTLPWQVERLGEQYVTVPDHLQSHYGQHEQVQPVFLRPQFESKNQPQLRLGCAVRLPATWGPRLTATTGNSPDSTADRFTNQAAHER